MATLQYLFLLCVQCSIPLFSSSLNTCTLKLNVNCKLKDCHKQETRRQQEEKSGWPQRPRDLNELIHCFSEITRPPYAISLTPKLPTPCELTSDQIQSIQKLAKAKPPGQLLQHIPHQEWQPRSTKRHADKHADGQTTSCREQDLQCKHNLKLASSRIHKPPYYKGLNSGSSHAPSHAKTNIESTAQSACYQNVAKEIAQIMQTQSTSALTEINPPHKHRII